MVRNDMFIYEVWWEKIYIVRCNKWWDTIWVVIWYVPRYDMQCSTRFGDIWNGEIKDIVRYDIWWDTRCDDIRNVVSKDI